MIKWSNILYILIIIFFTLLSCEEETKQPEEQIVGTWEWVKSIDPRFEVIKTPVTEGFNETWIFMEIDTVEIYIDGIIQNKYMYEFKLWNKVDPSVPESNSTKMLIINGESSFYSIGNDTLIIDYSYVDGWRNFYKREH